MSKSADRKERKPPADLFLIKRTVSAPVPEKQEDFKRSTQYYNEQDGGAQKKPHVKNKSIANGASKTIVDLSSNSSSTCSSLGAAVAGRIRVKDANILRSKSKPLEQSSAPDVGRRGGRGTSGSNADVHEAGVELDMCRRRLQKLASCTLGNRDSFDGIMDHCNRLEAFVQNLVVKAPELCSRQDFGAKVWNSSHYVVIEAMRKQLHEASCLPALKEQLLTFLTHSIEFYSGLVTSTESSCGFEVTQLVTGRAEFLNKSSRRMVMIGACLCQWCYIYLGDLARYREQLVSKPDWSKPREYYFNAQQLAPKDGRPYNQLAVIAISAQRRLDAIYFYMRSLAAKNPCMSAHDSLVGIFEDTCRKAKKVEEEEKMRPKGHRDQKKRGPKVPSNRHLLEKGPGVIRRKETWVMPGTEEWSEVRSSRQAAGVAAVEQSSCAEGVPTTEQQCEQMVTSELTKKLQSAFLVTHGKLFTKIGIESFSISLKRFLALWQCALQAQVTTSDSSQALKMVVINIFNIHHVAQNSDSEAGKKIYCGMAFCLALELCTAVFNRCLGQLELIEGSSSSSSSSSSSTAQAPLLEGSQQTRNSLIEECAHTGQGSLTSPQSFDSLPSHPDAPCLIPTLGSTAALLPAVKLWFDWLACQQDFWTSFLPVVDKRTLSAFWSTLFQFLNKCLTTYRSELSSVSQSPKPPLLWEDKITVGFMPLKASITTEETFAVVDAMQLASQVQCLVRLAVIVKVCKDLCTNLGSLLGISYDVIKEQFIYVSVDEELNGTKGSREREGSLKEDVQLLETSEEYPYTVAEDEEVPELPQEEQSIEEYVSDGEDMAIDKLKKERDKLSKELELHHHAMENAQTLISEAVNKASEEVYIEPKYLVPDTNCFISSLPAIQALVKSQLFVVAVPLTVMAELEGLSKGPDVESSTPSAKTSFAKQAMEYAKTEILNRSSHLKLLTTQGSLLSSLSLKEEVLEEASNDNLILKSSLHLHTKIDKGIKYPKGGDFYSVVLLTDDRNLRVKALANSLPVKDMAAFMLMAKLPL